ncbi:MAG TPA: PEP-CTERM sorting domain-containing protein [Terriglobales bacterium]|nr:PEP-CTERM sorting domain-containing protein [Terriglobales bacterium]
MKNLLGMLCVCIALLVAMPAVAGVVVGLPPDAGTGNCFPFGCAYSGEYQQVYTSSLFNGPITITDLEFFNTQVDFGATAMNSGNWAISLSTTSADWNTLSSTYANNIGANNTLVFNGDLSQPWAFGNTLTITLSTPFTYDPSQGNLLMDIFVTGATTPGGSIYFDTNGYNGGSLDGNTIFGRVYCSGCYPSGVVNNGYGLVTGFSTGTATPEPGTLMLLGSGALGIVGVLRRKMTL